MAETSEIRRHGHPVDVGLLRRARRAKPGKCFLCGCTEGAACLVEDALGRHGCSWVDGTGERLCTAHGQPLMHKAIVALRKAARSGAMSDEPTLFPLGNPPQPPAEVLTPLGAAQDALKRAQAALATGSWFIASKEFRVAGDALVDTSVALVEAHRLRQVERTGGSS